MMNKEQKIDLKLIDWPTITDKINPKIPTTANYYNNPQRRDPKTKKYNIKMTRSDIKMNIFKLLEHL